MAEIIENSNCENGGPTIKFLAPEPFADRWFNNTDDKAAFSALVKRNSKRLHQGHLLEDIKLADGYFGYPVVIDEDNHRGLFSHLYAHGRHPWRYISAQKMPTELIRMLAENGVALPMNNARHPEFDQFLEEQPVLMITELVDFIMSRLARDISQENDLLSVTFSAGSYIDHAFQPVQTISKRTSLFLSFAIPASIPLGVEKLRVGDYLEVRNEFTDFRKRLASVARDLVEDSFLDEEQSQSTFVKRLTQSIADLENQVIESERRLSKSRILKPTSFVLDMASTAIGVGVGHIFGDLSGALAGGAIGRTLGGITNQFSSYDTNGQFPKNTAMMKASVKRRLTKADMKVPNYWL
ncbi:hypothetical protein [Shimia thalassica]|uniref:hypothetical protein n=1 Tax=Shimia thalassica TaxID=1715693 RepID=UPI002735D77E|nr:hypothetical protein [Shimia thalassica]MDP2518965.1 hypothetical protein [Shimia thalassica]